MPSVFANTMTEAAALAARNVQFVANTGGASLIKTKLEAWIPGLALGLDPESPAHRTIMNWIPRGLEISAGIDTSLATIQSQGVADAVSVYVYQSAEAVAEAQIQGRITLAQANAIRAIYNSSW
jgi:hypothetical protein